MYGSRSRKFPNCDYMSRYNFNFVLRSSESEVAENEQESTCSDKVQLEMINKYIELMGYMEKKFDPIKREVFKDAPCKGKMSYMDKLKKTKEQPKFNKYFS